MIISEFNVTDAVYVCTLFVRMQIGVIIGCRRLMVRVRLRVRVRACFDCDVSIICVHVE